MDDQVAKAKARKKPVKESAIQAVEPAAIDEAVKLDDTIDTVQPGQEEPAMTEATENKKAPSGAFLLVFIFECFIVPGRNHLHDFCQVRTIKGNPII